MLEELQEKLQEKKTEAERRRDELVRALEADEVADPISSSIIATILITTAVSIGTSLLTAALAPRPKQTTGALQGALQIPQSDQGLPIVEGYGADPAANAQPFQPSHAYALEDRVVDDEFFYVVTTAGTSAAAAPTWPQDLGASVTSGTATFTNYGRKGGGFRLPMLIVWTSGIRKHSTTNRGGGGGKGRPKAPETTTIEYDLDLAIMPGRGPLTVKRIRANTDTIYQPFQGERAFYQAEASGNTKAGGAANVSDVLASGGSAVNVPQNGSLRWNNVFGDGTAVILEFYYKASSSISVQFDWNGEVFNDSLNSTGGVYEKGYLSGPFVLDSGTVNQIKVTNLSASALVFDRLGVRISGGPTGVPDPSVPPDDPVDPVLPPSPLLPFERPRARFAGELLEDVSGALTGAVQSGGNAGIAIYPGNTTQLPDPTMQAAIDAEFGPDSTPAFHNRCLIVLSNFFLTKFGGAIPLISTLAEHQTIDTFELLAEHFGERTGVLLSSDYDFSGIRRKFLRGIPVTPPYAPADVLEDLARVFNVYFVETDKIRAFERGTQPAVASLTSADIGWVDGDADDEEEELPALDFDVQTETELPRRFELTFVDPERDFEQNSVGTSRQVTSGERVEKIELALTMYSDEAREVTQRELYEAHVEATKHQLNLDWTYLWVQPGDTIDVEEGDGTTSSIFIMSIKPNIGVIPVEGVAEELAVYEQPVSVTGEGVFEIPPVPIPGMSLMFVYDGPLLRDEEASVNNGAGITVGAVKRRGDGQFPGATLFAERELEPEQLATFEVEATVGVCATVLTDATTAHGVVTDTVTVDLHNPEHVIESHTRKDLLAGAGACIVGDEVCAILTATREPDTATYPSRWYLTIGLRALRGTDFAVETHQAGERFALINSALKFVPLNLNEINVTRTYKMVTSGQSYDDAAEVEYAWGGGSVKGLSPVNAHRRDDSAGNSLLEWSGRSRLGHAVHDGVTGFDDVPAEHYLVEFTDSDYGPLPRPLEIPVITNLALAALFESDGATKFDGVDVNTLELSTAGEILSARSLQRITRTGNFTEATLYVTQGTAGFGLIPANINWRGIGNPYDFCDFWVQLERAPDRLRIFQRGTGVIHLEDASAYAADGARIRITTSGGQVRFIRDWVGDGTPSLVASTLAPAPPYRVYARCDTSDVIGGVTAEVRRVSMKSWSDPMTILTAGQKAEYGIGPTVYAKIYPVDARAGRGYPLKVALTNEL